MDVTNLYFWREVFIVNAEILIAIVAVLAVLLAAVAFHLYLYKNYHYLCPKCSNSFKPNSFLKSMFGINLFHKRRLRCTNCNTFVTARTKKD